MRWVHRGIPLLIAIIVVLSAGAAGAEVNSLVGEKGGEPSTGEYSEESPHQPESIRNEHPLGNEVISPWGEGKRGVDSSVGRFRGGKDSIGSGPIVSSAREAAADVTFTSDIGTENNVGSPFSSVSVTEPSTAIEPDVTVKWQFTSDQSFDYLGSPSPSPVVTNGIVYSRNSDGTVHALDADTGTERWRFTAEARNPPQPVIGDETVYVYNETTLYALDADTGTERWNVDPREGISSEPRPVDGTVYFNAGGTVRALDADTGTERWNSTIASGALTIDNGTVYVAGDGVYALDADTGTERWNASTGGLSISRPVVADGAVFTSVASTVVSLAFFEGHWIELA